jgi:hypothetical protein
MFLNCLLSIGVGVGHCLIDARKKGPILKLAELKGTFISHLGYQNFRIREPINL